MFNLLNLKKFNLLDLSEKNNTFLLYLPGIIEVYDINRNVLPVLCFSHFNLLKLCVGIGKYNFKLNI